MGICVLLMLARNELLNDKSYVGRDGYKAEAGGVSHTSMHPHKEIKTFGMQRDDLRPTSILVALLPAFFVQHDGVSGKSS